MAIGTEAYDEKRVVLPPKRVVSLKEIGLSFIADKARAVPQRPLAIRHCGITTLTLPRHLPIKEFINRIACRRWSLIPGNDLKSLREDFLSVFPSPCSESYSKRTLVRTVPFRISYTPVAVSQPNRVLEFNAPITVLRGKIVNRHTNVGVVPVRFRYISEAGCTIVWSRNASQGFQPKLPS